MILDAGVLISIDRQDPAARALLEAAERTGTSLHTSEAVIAQSWRDGARQTRLAAVLRGVTAHPVADGRAVGTLLGRAGRADVVDAHVVLLAAVLDHAIVTGDRDDLTALAAAMPPPVPVVHAWP